MTIDKPNQRTYRIYDFVISYKSRHNGNSPSMEEIGAAVHAVKSSVFDHLNMLKAMGRIDFVPGSSRSIEIPNSRWVAPNKNEV